MVNENNWFSCDSCHLNVLHNSVSLPWLEAFNCLNHFGSYSLSVQRGDQEGGGHQAPTQSNLQTSDDRMTDIFNREPIF